MAVGCATSVPRSIVARSRIPIRPRPSCGGSRRGRRTRPALVRDRDLEGIDLVAHDHPSVAAARVLERVRERLLDDPVGGDREARVERSQVARRPRAPRRGRRTGSGPASSSRRSSPGVGSEASCSPRIPSIRRMSVSARRPVVAMASSAARASSGRLSMTRSAPPAWITITLTWCVTTSCSSRAIRSRSSRTAALGPLVALSLEPLRALLQGARVQATDPRRVAEQPRDDEDQLRLDERCRATAAMPARPTNTIGEEGGGQPPWPSATSGGRGARRRCRPRRGCPARRSVTGRPGGVRGGRSTRPRRRPAPRAGTGGARSAAGSRAAGAPG